MSILGYVICLELFKAMFIYGSHCQKVWLEPLGGDGFIKGIKQFVKVAIYLAVYRELQCPEIVGIRIQISG